MDSKVEATAGCRKQNFISGLDGGLEGIEFCFLQTTILSRLEHLLDENEEQKGQYCSTSGVFSVSTAGEDGSIEGDLSSIMKVSP